MKRQVTVAEYARCVDEAACPRIAVPAGAQDVPVVGVSWHDASAYAAWMSRKTGITHRLPTDEEWTFAAAEKARDEAMPLVDPSRSGAGLDRPLRSRIRPLQAGRDGRSARRHVRHQQQRAGRPGRQCLGVDE